MKTPDSLRLEHEQLHARLAEAAAQPGRIGEAARTVANIMHPHFLREDEGQHFGHIRRHRSLCEAPEQCER